MVKTRSQSKIPQKGKKQREIKPHEAALICTIHDEIMHLKKIANQLNTLSCYQDQDQSAWRFPLWAKDFNQKKGCISTFFKNATQEEKDDLVKQEVQEGVSLDCKQDFDNNFDNNDLAISDEISKIISMMKDDLKHWKNVANDLNIICSYRESNGNFMIPHWAKDDIEKATCVKTFFENATEDQKNEFFIQSES